MAGLSAGRGGGSSGENRGWAIESNAMSERVVCDMCGRRVEPHGHYVVRVEVFADPTMPATTSDEIEEKDFEGGMKALMEQMKGMSAEELQDQVYRKMEFRLCFDCRGVYLANPLGMPRGRVKAGDN